MKKYFSLFLLFLFSCSTKQPINTLIIAIADDVSSLNPLFAYSEYESNITDILFLSLISESWNEETGEIETDLMLAKKIDWAKDSSFVKVDLREDCYWSDGRPTTAADVVFSFLLYSNPEIQSRALGYFENFNLNNKGMIDSSKTFEVLSDYSLKIKFRNGVAPSLIDIDWPILPKHILGSVSIDKINNHEFNLRPISNGPYRLKEWKRNQFLSFELNEKSFLASEKSIKKIIFKIIPDAKSRIIQLENNEVDYVDMIEPESIEKLIRNENIKVKQIKGRFYDYIGFRNVSDYKKNKLFADKNNRRAIAFGIDRETIIKQYLKNSAEIATGPISPIFKSLQIKNNNTISYNPDSAKSILRSCGWSDNNYDGILEKDNLKFRFNLNVPTGNPRRQFAAKLFQANLKQIGIEMKINFLEMNAFMDGLFNREFEAWMVGWGSAIPPNLKVQWYSNLEQTPMNFSNYHNKKVDSLLISYEKTKSKEKRRLIFLQLNEILSDEQPHIFLYWIDDIVAFNKRISRYYINSFSSMQSLWRWELN